ncbi:MAG TPA: hypothetical protein VG370_21940 [Chloroflexota bacterium]|jgi:hypothetical protein|nr:hypothetical protein [Chloroflexota bacterium]
MRRPPRPPDDEPQGSGPAERRIGRRLARPSPAVRREVLRRQAGLAERVASFLRDQPRRDRVGIAAGALLVAAAGAALVYDVQRPGEQVETVDLAAAEPLTQEVREGLPTAPGRYRVYPDSVQRDQRGVHHFDWEDPAGGGATPFRRQASASLLRLAPGDVDELEIVPQGDPILYLREDTPVGIVAETAESAGSTGSGVGGGGGGGGGRTFVWLGSWYPYQGSYVSRTPLYRRPSESAIAPGERLVGGVEAAQPPSPTSRVVRVPGRADAVSGQARGTGGGTAATNRLGGGGRTTLAPARSGGFTSGIGGGTSASG